MKKITVKHHSYIQKAFYILAAIAAIASYLTEMKGGPRPLLWVAGGLIAVSIAWRFIFIKCPGCGDNLADSKTIPDICPCCGYDLITNQPKENENEQNH